MIGLKKGSVQLVPYQTEWKTCFEEEANCLQVALEGHVFQIEHVGSTAVEGLSAKPIIDIMLGVEHLSEGKILIPLLEEIDYTYIQPDPFPNVFVLVKGTPDKRTHHLFIQELATPYWDEKILFRDYLRAYPEATTAYEDLKQDLAQKYATDRPSYTAKKAKFITEILEKARKA